MKRIFIITCSLFLLFLISCTQASKDISDSAKEDVIAEMEFTGLELGNASVQAQNNELVISTGKVESRWKWTGKGFVTAGFKNLSSGKEWIEQKPTYAADWDLRNFVGDAKLLSLKAERSTDENFTSEHIRLSAEIEYEVPENYYPESSILMRYEIWVYPGAPGLRTQMFLQGKGAWFPGGIACSNNNLVDYLPVSVTNLKRETVGFFNDHDGRAADSIDFVEVNEFEAPVSGKEKYESNILFLSNDEEGFGLVKESHMVVNKPGINTGYFTCSEDGVESTGWGLSMQDITRDEYQPCWASWRICWEGGEDEKQLAMKVFDRYRFPVQEADVRLMVNVWGGGKHVASAEEENIIKEIKSCSDLGIEVVQIDAGWEDRQKTDSLCGWYISESVYPSGMDRIMKLAEENKVAMGIWNTAENVNKYDDRLKALNDLGFYYYKIDIGTWNKYDMLQELTQHARELKKHSDYKAVINWDVTHKGLRVGYLFNREYGNLFLQNRRLPIAGKQNKTSTYIPRLILKDQWMGAKYLNLNQIQFNVQTTEFVPSERSNARLYGDEYSFAMVMMSSPLFFTETHRYSEEDRVAVKNIIRIYKKHRDELYKGYVFSLGERPNDASWAGFQNYNPNENYGYMTLFREIDNTEDEKRIQLHFLKDQTLKIEDLVSGKEMKIAVDGNGYAEFMIDDAASFKFYKYTVL